MGEIHKAGGDTELCVMRVYKRRTKAKSLPQRSHPPHEPPVGTSVISQFLFFSCLLIRIKIEATL